MSRRCSSPPITSSLACPVLELQAAPAIHRIHRVGRSAVLPEHGGAGQLLEWRLRACGAFTAGIDFDRFTITSATSDLKGSFGINLPLSPSGSFSSQFYPKMFAQELRANSTGESPLHWVLGAAYQDGEGPQSNLADQQPDTTINADNNTLTKNYAVFGEMSYDLFDGKIVPLVGLRTLSRQAHRSRTRTSSLPSNKDVDDVARRICRGFRRTI